MNPTTGRFLLIAFTMAVATTCNEKARESGSGRNQSSDAVALDSSNITAVLDTMSDKTMYRYILGSAGRRTFPQPANWGNRRWAPLKYFGPIYGKSPDVVLQGTSATMVYDRYFTAHADAGVFRKYYGQTLPGNAPALPTAVPGNFPNANSGFLETRLSLDRLLYSSRYGGSFQLVFQSEEDYMVEYAGGNIAYDIGFLEMNVFVKPMATSFNPNAPLQVYSGVNEAVHIEFNVSDVVGYDITSNPRALTVRTDDPVPALTVSLQQVASGLQTGGSQFPLHVVRLSHALVHAEFWDVIGQTNTVTAVEISDGFFFPRTRTGIATAIVSLRVSDINLNTEPGEEEIDLSVGGNYMMNGLLPEDDPGFHKEFSRIGNHESTRWITIGVFRLDSDCRQLLAIILGMRVVESDTFSDDHFTTDPQAFQIGALNCTGMQTAFDNGDFGIYRNLPDQRLTIMNGDEVRGTMDVQMRVSVVRQ